MSTKIFKYTRLIVTGPGPGYKNAKLYAIRIKSFIFFTFQRKILT
jgi:hypothetical protein